MAAFLQGLFFLLLGIWLLRYDYRAFTIGTIATGASRESVRRNFYDKRVVSKIDDPIAFWLVFIIYGVIGISLIIYSIRLFIGNVDPFSFKVWEWMPQIVRQP